MLSFSFKVSGLKGLNGREYVKAIDRFQAEASDLVLQAVRDVLGHDALYTLTPKYAERKRRNPALKRIAGKSADQPLILTGDGIYGAVHARIEGNEIHVDIDPGKGTAKDFDYAEYWQSGEGSNKGFEGVDYLGAGLNEVEARLDQLLLDIICEEMGL